MEHVMIALVSNQRMQNIIPILQGEIKFKRLWLVQSTDAESSESRLAQAVKNTFDVLNNIIEVKLARQSVNAYSVDESKAVVAGLAYAEKANVTIVNFTGGTKLMSIGAFLAAKEAGVDTIYVDTDNERILCFDPSGQVKEQKFDLRGRLSTATYLRAHAELVEEDRTSRQKLPHNAVAAAQELLNIWPRCKDTLEKLGSAVSSGMRGCENHVLDNQVVEILAKHQLVQEIKVNNKVGWEATSIGRPFVTGKWLEAMVEHLLKDSNLFDEVSVNLCIAGIENELDIVALSNGQLAIIECKSGSLGGQTTLNKLEAIRGRFGTFTRSFFVTSRQDEEVDPSFRKRASKNGVRLIITSENLLQIAQEIKGRIRGLS